MKFVYGRNKKIVMKKIMFALAPLLLVAIISCKKIVHQSSTIVRDCTGTYLRINEKDYQVCNLEKVNPYADGDLITVTYKKINKCSSSNNDAITCKLFHANEGWIEVTKIK